MTQDRFVVTAAVEHSKDDDYVVAHDERNNGTAAESDRAQPGTNVVPGAAAQSEGRQVLAECDDRVNQFGGGQR